MMKRVLTALLFLVIGLVIFGPIVAGIYDFISQRDAFDRAFVLYDGVSGLMIIFVWLTIMVSIAILAFNTKEGTKHKGRGAHLGAVFIGMGLCCLWFAFFHYYERSLTLYYIENYVNTAERQYILCDEKSKTTTKSQYSKIYLFADARIGCAPYEALSLRNFDTPHPRAAIAQLNALHPLP